METVRVGVHLHGIYGGLHLDAVGGRDRIEWIDADQVLARLVEGVVQIGIVGARDQQIGLRLVVDVGHLIDADAVDGVAIEATAVGHQVHGLIVDAAVGVHAAVVAGAGVIPEARHLVGIASRRGMGHVADHADAGRQVFTQQPVHRRGVVAGGVGQIDELAPKIGKRLVDGAGLVVIKQIRAVFGDPVGELVADDIVGQRKPIAIHHLRTVPEGVGADGGAVVYGGDQCHPCVVEAVAAVLVEKEIVGVAGEDMRGLGVGIAGQAVGIGFVAHQGPGQARGVVGAVGLAVPGVFNQIDAQGNAPRLGIDEQ